MRVRSYQSSQMQTMFDVALQHYGSIQDGLAFLLNDNKHIIDEHGKLYHGATTVNIRKDTNDNRILKYLSDYEVIPVTEAGQFHNNVEQDPYISDTVNPNASDNNTNTSSNNDNIDQTFANTDLTFDGDHVHDLNGHTMRIRNGHAIIEGDLVIDGDGRGIIFREDGQDYRLRTERTDRGTFMMLEKV